MPAQNPRTAAKTTARKGPLTTSNVVAVLFVLAAGAIAWFGTRPGSEPAASPEQVTLAADVAAVDEESATPAPPVVGSLPTRLVAAAAGIDTPISEVGVVREAGRAVWETAWHSAGHHLTSARPGQPGNMILTGHVSVADSHNAAVFANLDQLDVGDIIDVYSGDQVFHYAVQSKTTVLPTALQVLRSSTQSRVTLITCTPDLKHRLIVVGTLV